MRNVKLVLFGIMFISAIVIVLHGCGDNKLRPLVDAQVIDIVDAGTVDATPAPDGCAPRGNSQNCH